MNLPNKIVIRDPVHGDIDVNEQVSIELINSYEFQRLRRVSQLSGPQLAFPGASHTRFSHSIGTYHVVNKILNNDNFKNRFSNKEILITKIAGLLHDIGHGPFSHTFEHINKVNTSCYKHEFYSAKIITSETTNINKILKKHGFTNCDIKNIANIITGKSDHVLANLVSSQLDADRMDYLIRDNLFTGTGYGYIDIQWIIRLMRLSEDKKLILYDYKAVPAIENYLIGRYHMYEQIYQHHISIGYDLHFRYWFKRLYDLYHKQYNFINKDIIERLKPLFYSDEILLTKYIELDDYKLTTMIFCLNNEKDPILHYLGKNFLHRHLMHKVDNDQLEKHKNRIIKRFNKEAVKYLLISYKQELAEFYSLNKNEIYINCNNVATKIEDISKIIKNNYKFKTKNNLKWYTIL